MFTRVLSAMAVSVALFGAPAFATDTDSLAAFLSSCGSDSKGCESFARDLITSARNARYGCIPKSLSVEDAGDELYRWMKNSARDNPKYEKMSLEDVMWDGVDTLWPCRK